MNRDTYMFLKSLRNKLKERCSISFSGEIEELSRIISEYEKAEINRDDDLLETLAESV